MLQKLIYCYESCIIILNNNIHTCCKNSLAMAPGSCAMSHKAGKNLLEK